MTITNDNPEPILTDTTAADFSAMCVAHAGTRAAAGGDVRLLGTFRDDFTGPLFDSRWVAGNPFGAESVRHPPQGWCRWPTRSGPSCARRRRCRPRRSTSAPASPKVSFNRSALPTSLSPVTTRDSRPRTVPSLWAITNPGSGEVPTNLGPIPSGFHDYTIERVALPFDVIVRYRIDGAVVAEHTLLAGELPASLTLWLANRGTDPSRALTIDRVETDPLFATTGGTFESCVLDALEVMAWNNLTWDALVPAGTTLAVSTRTSITTSNPASPSGWSPWSAPLAASGAPITSPPGRYLQYRLTLATGDAAVSPIVSAVAAEAFGPAPPLFSIAPATVAEHAGPAAFTVSLSWPSSAPVGVSYATGAGTATPADFTPASGPLAFAPGQVSQVVNVAVVNDVLHEAAETFTVTLSAPSGATIATPQAIGTITDDDPLPVAVADAYATPFGTPLVVAAPGVLSNDSNSHGGTMSATLVSAVAHGTLVLGANGSVNYTPADGYVGADSFVYQIADGSGTGNSVTVSITVGTAQPPTADAYTAAFQTTLTVPAPGVLGNDGSAIGGLTAQLVTSVAHGTLTLAPDGGVSYTPEAGFTGDDSFTYRTQSAGGLSVPATVTITVNEPTDVQAPQELRVSSIEGNVVTFRWKAPSVGPDPTGYVLEGGVAPAQTLVALPIGHAAPAFTVTAPNGSFFIRVRSIGPGGQSATSNEIVAHVQVPMAPSAPTALQGTTSGNTLHLAWTPSFAGGRADGVILDVSGSVAASIPLAAQERISLAGVPSGTYTLRVRASNATGSSSASAPIDRDGAGVRAQPRLSRRPTCLAYASGGTTYLLWDPPATGEAPTGYQISVPGIGVLPTGLRSVSGALPGGDYAIEVRSIGACGASLPAMQVLKVP